MAVPCLQHHRRTPPSNGQRQRRRRQQDSYELQFGPMPELQPEDRHGRTAVRPTS